MRVKPQAKHRGESVTEYAIWTAPAPDASLPGHQCKKETPMSQLDVIFGKPGDTAIDPICKMVRAQGRPTRRNRRARRRNLLLLRARLP